MSGREEKTVRQIVLASTSVYRRGLLERLGLPFETCAPEVVEGRLPEEPPPEMARRLAETKARAVIPRFPHAIIIGCDQVAECDGQILGKPGGHHAAIQQLELLSGREAIFHTALCLHDARSSHTVSRVVANRVRFRRLDSGMIERYLEREQPYDCAGSAKSEGLGIALIERMDGDDPNALVGLPLIVLIDLLGELDVRVL